jgi:hypothetical protein
MAAAYDTPDRLASATVRTDHVGSGPSSGLRLRTGSETLPDMFKRHRSDPVMSNEPTLRDRLDSLAVAERTEPAGAGGPFGSPASRGRFGASVAASTGLRDRLRQPALTTHRG